MYKPTPYALNIKWHREQLELVHKKCDSAPTETSTFVSEETAPVTTAEVSKASPEASSEEESGLLTESPEQTTSSEPTVSSTANAAAKTNLRQMFWSWSLVLLLSMNLYV
ncbi:Ff.00g116840.m01.CDS01 [Fusarium sp. VM40]|nr:Ff.00g116840.m01.CDS01 [Fusarium sp. VM40]